MVAKTQRHRWHRCVQRVGSVILNPQKLRPDGRAGVAGRARERQSDCPKQWLDHWCLTVLRLLVIAQIASNVLRLHLMANGQASMLRLLRSGGKNT